MYEKTVHDFSSLSLRCVECGVPTTRRDMECRPSTDDSPAGIEELHDAIARGSWE